MDPHFLGGINKSCCFSVYRIFRKWGTVPMDQKKNQETPVVKPIPNYLITVVGSYSWILIPKSMENNGKSSQIPTFTTGEAHISRLNPVTTGAKSWRRGPAFFTSAWSLEEKSWRGWRWNTSIDQTIFENHIVTCVLWYPYQMILLHIYILYHISSNYIKYCKSM